MLYSHMYIGRLMGAAGRKIRITFRAKENIEDEQAAIDELRAALAKILEHELVKVQDE